MYCVNNTYFIVYNLLTKKFYKRISLIQDNIEQLQGIKPEDLGVSKLISMNLDLRREVMGENRPKLAKFFMPYSKTIDHIIRIRATESVICKLEFIYRLFTEIMITELHEFWWDEKYYPKDKLYVDADSLKALLIYVVVKSKCAKILMDIICVEEFTPESVKFTNRFYFMTVLHSAFEFLEEINESRMKNLKQSIEEREAQEVEWSSDFDDGIEKEEEEDIHEKWLKSEPESSKIFSTILVNDYFETPVRKFSKGESFVNKDENQIRSETVKDALFRSFWVLDPDRSDSIIMNINFYKNKDK